MSAAEYLYGIFQRAMADEGISIRPWGKLPSYTQAAWQATAARANEVVDVLHA